jgi:hypothetical protein
MTSLTDRYLAAALRHIPADKRDDVERELRSSIGDAVDDRTAAGEAAEPAERAVLEGMGDPARLAAGISGRPMYLIGPELFFDYRRLLTLLLGIVVPLAAAVMAVIEIAGGGDIGDAIGAAISTAINVAIQTVFWVTVVFVVIERADAIKYAEIRRPGARWTVEELPQLPRTRISLSDTIGELVGLLIGIGGLFALRAVTWTDASTGQQVALLHPSLNGFWFSVFVGVLVAQVGFRIVLYVLGRWTIPLGVVYTILGSAFAVPIVYLALNGLLVNPAFAAAIGYPPLAEGDAPVMLLVAVGAMLVTAWEIFDGFRQALRDRARPSLAPLS